MNLLKIVNIAKMRAKYKIASNFEIIKINKLWYFDNADLIL